MSRFYPILDTGTLLRLGIDPVDAMRELAQAGTQVAQLRHKGEWTRATWRLAEKIAEAAREGGLTFIVNDRADVALAVGADGVHLGQSDLPPAAVRSFAGDRLRIGLSTHNEAQLRAAVEEPIDYVALGPIFGTQSKENPDPVVGLEELNRLRGLTALPLVAIGGITRDTAPKVWGAGADGCAVISDMLREDWRASIRAWAQLEGGT